MDFHDRRTGETSAITPRTGPWSALQKGDVIIGLDRSRVTGVRHTTYYDDPVNKPVIQGKTVVDLHHPERGRFTRTEPSWLTNVDYYRPLQKRQTKRSK